MLCRSAKTHKIWVTKKMLKMLFQENRQNKSSLPVAPIEFANLLL